MTEQRSQKCLKVIKELTEYEHAESGSVAPSRQKKEDKNFAQTITFSSNVTSPDISTCDQSVSVSTRREGRLFW